MTEEFHVSWKGQTAGPFTRQEIEAHLRSGEITPLHAIRRNGELIDAARWLHSLRPANPPSPPTPAPEPTKPSPPPAPIIPASVHPGSITQDFSKSPDHSRVTPPPPPPPDFAAFESPSAQGYQPPSPQVVISSHPKSRIAFILLGLFLGGFGIHNFYAGYTGKGIAQLLLNLFLFWTVIVPIGVIIWIIAEVITVTRDAQGQPFA